MSEPIQILKRYPIRPDNSINLSAMALDALDWPAGTKCVIFVDKEHNRIIIEKAVEE